MSPCGRMTTSTRRNRHNAPSSKVAAICGTKSDGKAHGTQKPTPYPHLKRCRCPSKYQIPALFYRFFRHLAANGTHELSTANGSPFAKEALERHSSTKTLEFPKGVIYADHRMDLCKQALGPPNIDALMEALGNNFFVKEFLLGNNIIGQRGAIAISKYVEKYPNRINTWYLAGNCIAADSFSRLVNSWIKSQSVTNVWLKRNPLGPSAAADLCRLVEMTRHLRTLDVDQTELDDSGIATFFELLTNNIAPVTNQLTLPLEILYMSGNGASIRAMESLSDFLAASRCKLHSLYMSNNPLGDTGMERLSHGLMRNSSITRLLLSSTGISDDGAKALLVALTARENSGARFRVLDISQSYATDDLGQRYNYITDAIIPSLVKAILTLENLEYLNLGDCGLSQIGIMNIVIACLQSHSLLFFSAKSVLSSSKPDADALFASKELARLELELQDHLTSNVKAKYGSTVTYKEFLENDRRWLISDQQNVRKVDSVYRTRDMDRARRKLETLNKLWIGDEPEWLGIVQPISTAKGREV